MKRLILEQSSEMFLTPHAGLALAGRCLNGFSPLEREAKKLPLRHGISHADLLKTYIGMLCVGKNDFEAAEGFREDLWFAEAMGIGQVPSAVRLRQRFDANARELGEVVDELSVPMLTKLGAPVTPLTCGHVALDLDVFPMDNSGSHKEGVSQTYHGYHGYCPVGAYLGQEGWCLALELREGSHHSQLETPYTMERVLARASALTSRPLLVRKDSGFDALENMVLIEEHSRLRQQGGGAPIDYLIKWNPRRQDASAWLKRAETEGRWSKPRRGKRVALFSVTETRKYNKQAFRLRRVMRVIERSIDARGQALLIPEIEIDGWWTSLDAPEEEIIGLYEDHGTHEQFHSEFKTDLDIERPPSGKFDTNALVLSCAMVAYNILRWLGLIGLIGPHAPPRAPAKRRRLRTVINELMYVAARLIRTGRRLKLAFGRHCPAYAAFRYVYLALNPG